MTFLTHLSRLSSKALKFVYLYKLENLPDVCKFNLIFLPSRAQVKSLCDLLLTIMCTMILGILVSIKKSPSVLKSLR